MNLLQLLLPLLEITIIINEYPCNYRYAITIYKYEYENSNSIIIIILIIMIIIILIITTTIIIIIIMIIITIKTDKEWVKQSNFSYRFTHETYYSETACHLGYLPCNNNHLRD